MKIEALKPNSTPLGFSYQSKGETRTKTPYYSVREDDPLHHSIRIASETLHNIKYNTDGNNVFTVREQIDAMSNHYNLKLTAGTAKLLMELYGLEDIAIPEISVDDKSGKNVMSKIQKTFEDKMHVMYTRIADMGLLQHNLRKE